MAMTDKQADEFISVLFQLMENTTLTSAGIINLKRILTNHANINPTAVVHNGQVFAFSEYNDDCFAVWDEKALKALIGCGWCSLIKRSEAPWLLHRDLLIVDGFSMDEIEQAKVIMDELT